MKPSLATPLLARRTFLRRAASAAVLACGAPMIVPGHVLGAGGAVPPNSRVAVGFIGTGRQCVYSNIPLFLAEPDAQCVAVCDTDSWRMDKARRPRRSSPRQNVRTMRGERTDSPACSLKCVSC